MSTIHEEAVEENEQAEVTVETNAGSMQNGTEHADGEESGGNHVGGGLDLGFPRGRGGDANRGGALFFGGFAPGANRGGGVFGTPGRAGGRTPVRNPQGGPRGGRGQRRTPQGGPNRRMDVNEEDIDDPQQQGSPRLTRRQRAEVRHARSKYDL